MSIWLQTVPRKPKIGFAGRLPGSLKGLIRKYRLLYRVPNPRVRLSAVLDGGS